MKTIKEIADNLNVSKTTIRRYIKKLRLNIVVDQSGITLLDNDAVNLISAAVNQRAEHDAETPEHMYQNSGTGKDLQYQNIAEHSGTCTGTAEHMNRNIVEQLINSKDEQIEQMQKQIDFLKNQITELTTALKASQSIQAMYMQRIEQQEEQEPEHKGILARLFKK